ncbi:hypothetical protein PFICI_03384 [Pestalotiopsis fici W106-1]|uniref:Chitinase domain-containing protein 1 n=1 Tax=Pestalotiopsis fici (strain W106-1 / CGMCC3.15140) TaxID=1229662 RepID=W3XH88_PESFW|nr:uncharacterized protein PFICI_03384 [Pestalotiopsis fici W106-1]ETS85359.1 hypothetical protein PFICI_03384 [Pestalotiopsis fici W106-1]
MSSMKKAVHLAFCLAWVAISASGADDIDAGHQVPLQGETAADAHTRQHPELPVLGYVTPWHSRGKQLVEEYRSSFDIVSPVWYTVHPTQDDAEVYTVRGGPPDKDDEEWYLRLQKPSPAGSKPLQIVPRFFLDGWMQDDFRQLVFNETRWSGLASAILRVVEDMSFDGVVFESAVSHALHGPLSELAQRLWDKEKTMVLVLPPTRKHDESLNDISEQTVTLLADVVDYFSVMTYDMTGPGGNEWEEPFPASSPLHAAQQQHKVRVPGPNTSAAWIRHNIMALSKQEYDGQQEFSNLQSRDASKKVGLGKLLIGLPLYGYKYPVLFADKDKGRIIQGSDGEEDELCILRGPGEAVVMSQIEELIEEHQPELQRDDDDEPEYYFDYMEDGGSWRLYLPTAKSMAKSLKAISQSSESLGSACGVALWEVGQSSTELLLTL